MVRHLPSGADSMEGSDYKSRLISLNLLPLMCTYEILDILFLGEESVETESLSSYP